VRDGLRGIGAGPGPVDALGIAARPAPASAPATRPLTRAAPSS
jgi:hypothetical protein